MGQWMSAAKSQIPKIAEIIQSEHPGVDLHMGAVFYRDYGDNDQLVTIPFTSDILKFVGEIQPIEPEGGDDAAEDVAGGFLAMHEMEWDENAIKNVFLICDAPPHGKEWHDILISDRFPDNEYGLGILVEQTASRNIKLTIIKATAYIDVMICRMNDIYTALGKSVAVADLVGQSTRERSVEAETFTRTLSSQVGDSIRDY
jgi:hypothetical protein